MTNIHIPYLTMETEPATDPVTLAETKLYLRVDGVTEDSSINSLISAARHAAEKYMRRSLVTQSWKLSYDDYSPSKVFLLRGPVQSVTSVRIIETDGSEIVVDSGKYRLNAGKEILLIDAALMGNIVEIVYVAGFGDAPDVPEDIRQGILLHIARMFENRSDEAEIPASARRFYDNYRRVCI